MNRKVLIPTIILFLVFSCGGVIGNIEKYRFDNVSTEELKAALNRVYAGHPDLIKSDTTMYGMNDGEDFYFKVKKDGTDYIFNCHVINYNDPNYNAVDLSLTTATEWGEIMNLAPKMGFFEKRKYRKLFEETILPKIRGEVTNVSQ
jgi:hypothetical protein